MKFHILEERKVPETLKKWVEVNKNQEKHTVLHQDNKTYVLITRGTKNTSGYDLKLRSVETDQEKIKVKVEYINPNPQQILAQVMSCPTLILEISAEAKDVIVDIIK